jgi:hypothetical protein
VPDLFIGVVSHERTRFPASQGPDGLAARLARELDALDTVSQVHVETTDLLDPETVRLDGRTVQSSLSAQLDLAREWDRYVAGGRPGWRPTVDHLLRWAQRQRHRVQPPGVATMRRLVNIELAHIDLLQRGLASGAPWVLILEDDAESPDVTDCARGLAGLLSEPGPQPAFVNVSESFSPARLGTRRVLHPHDRVRWRGTVPREVQVAERPVTNTVCAVLYRAGFVRDLLAEFEGIPLEPILPIDWKLNLALLRMVGAGRLGSGDCWFVAPGPIDQLSMTAASHSV